MKHISSESPLQDASNGGILMRLASLDGELFVKNCFWKFRIISLSIDPRRMKMPPFDASRHGDSDDMCFKFMRSLDGEILQFKSQFLELSGYFWQVSVDKGPFYIIKKKIIFGSLIDLYRARIVIKPIPLTKTRN